MAVVVVRDRKGMNKLASSRSSGEGRGVGVQPNRSHIIRAWRGPVGGLARRLKRRYRRGGARPLAGDKWRELV